MEHDPTLSFGETMLLMRVLADQEVEDEHMAVLKRFAIASLKLKEYEEAILTIPGLDDAMGEALDTLNTALQSAHAQTDHIQAELTKRIEKLEGEVRSLTISRDHWKGEVDRMIEEREDANFW